MIARGPALAALATGCALAALTLAAASQSQTAPSGPAAPIANADAAQIERGRYLAVLGDCAACHTGPQGQPYAGGMGFKAPFGVIYAANITPDRTAGVGAWSEEQFWRSMHEGRRADGAHLYPAFPYPYFTHVSRQDVDDLRAYLLTIPASSYRPPANKLIFPVNIRASMTVWNALYFRPEPFQPRADRSAEWNRGAYLVTGLGHCGACHAPKNFLQADSRSRPLQGGKVEDWFAPNLDNAVHGGLANWSREELIEFLKSGRNAKSNGGGSMSSVLTHSTTQMSDADLGAIATYLKSLPASSSVPRETPSARVMAVGAAIYRDQCSACHGVDGAGEPRIFPPLAGNANVQAHDPSTVLRYILVGGASTATPQRPTPITMPSFAWKLSDEEIANVTTYVRASWGNVGAPVSAGAVAHARHRVADHPKQTEAPVAAQR